MAPNLPDLPGELLIKIVESDSVYQQRYLYEKLRATSKELNVKLTRSYGTRFFSTLYVPLNESGMSKLSRISDSELAYHVQTVIVKTRTLMEEEEFDPASESSDFDSHSWYGSDQQDTYHFRKVAFDEGTLDFLMSGACGDILGRALTGLPNLKQFYIQQPGIVSGMKASKVSQLKTRWSVALRTLVSVALAKAAPLETLAVRKYGADVPVSVSILNVMPVFLKQLSCLEKLHWNLSLDVEEDYFSEYVRILNGILTAAPKLTDLGIGLGGAEHYEYEMRELTGQHPPKSYVFFKQLATTLPLDALRRLKLSHLTTRKKYLAMMLRSCCNTLQALTLDCVSLGSMDYSIFKFLCKEMNLKEITLSRINQGGQGLFFDAIHFARPKCIDNYTFSGIDSEDWVLVQTHTLPQHRLELAAANGDEVQSWLMEVDWMQGCWGKEWAWDFGDWDLRNDY